MATPGPLALPAPLGLSALPAQQGSISLVIGPMFSGKTTEVVTRVRRYALAGKPCLVVKYSRDERYAPGSVVASHAEVRQDSTPESSSCAAIRVVAVERLADAAAAGLPETVVGVDEGQFFPDLVLCCEQWAAEGRHVIVAALDGDFRRRPFGQVCELVPLSESVVKLSGVCMRCRERASAFSQRLSSSTAVVEIGACELYRSVCRGCFASP